MTDLRADVGQVIMALVVIRGLASGEGVFALPPRTNLAVVLDRINEVASEALKPKPIGTNKRK
jgi:hypothetical protein